jgi:hypothetical protein
MTRVAIYTRVSTGAQTTENQLRELRAAAERLGHLVVAEFIDNGISWAKGRDQRPALPENFDTLFDTRDYLIDTTWPNSVTVRNPGFIKNALHVNKATDKHNIRVEIVDQLGHAHLQMHADGGIKKVAGANIAIPTKNVGRTSTGAVQMNQKPMRLLRSVKKGNLIFQEQGRGKKNRKLVLMYSLHPSARIKKDVPFREEFAAKMKEAALRHFPERMRQAMNHT